MGAKLTMRNVKIAAIAVAVIVVLILILQNTEPVATRILFATIEMPPNPYE